MVAPDPELPWLCPSGAWLCMPLLDSMRQTKTLPPNPLCYLSESYLGSCHLQPRVLSDISNGTQNFLLSFRPSQNPSTTPRLKSPTVRTSIILLWVYLHNTENLVESLRNLYPHGCSQVIINNALGSFRKKLVFFLFHWFTTVLGWPKSSLGFFHKLLRKTRTRFLANPIPKIHS